MNEPIDDGGPAFPNDERDANGQFRQHFGMTLRDWFAGQALAHIPELLDAHEKNKAEWVIAEWAYRIADAMIAARKEPK